MMRSVRFRECKVVLVDEVEIVMRSFWCIVLRNLVVRILREEIR